MFQETYNSSFDVLKHETIINIALLFEYTILLILIPAQHEIQAASKYMSRRMGKLTICIGEKKAQISFTETAKLISAFVFVYRDSTF